MDLMDKQAMAARGRGGLVDDRDGSSTARDKGRKKSKAASVAAKLEQNKVMQRHREQQEREGSYEGQAKIRFEQQRMADHVTFALYVVMAPFILAVGITQQGQGCNRTVEMLMILLG